MAIVKANYVKRGKGERGRAKATIRYITHRRDRDGHTVTRELFGYDGALTKEQTYRMIDEARRGTLFYRIVISPAPGREDRYKDLNLKDLTLDTMLRLEERLGKPVQFVATLHDDHAPHRHVHTLVLVQGKRLTREDFQALRLERAFDTVLRFFIQPIDFIDIINGPCSLRAPVQTTSSRIRLPNTRMMSCHSPCTSLLPARPQVHR
jgi:hypothetical protein